MPSVSLFGVANVRATLPRILQPVIDGDGNVTPTPVTAPQDHPQLDPTMSEPLAAGDGEQRCGRRGCLLHGRCDALHARASAAATHRSQRTAGVVGHLGERAEL